jgi:hypothetical protein
VKQAIDARLPPSPAPLRGAPSPAQGERVTRKLRRLRSDIAPSPGSLRSPPTPAGGGG